MWPSCENIVVSYISEGIDACTSKAQIDQEVISFLIQPLVNPEREAVMNNHIKKVHCNQLTGTTHMVYIYFSFPSNPLP